MKKRRVLTVSLGLVVLGVAALAASMLHDAGAFKTLVRHGGEHCEARTAPGFIGPEDMVATRDGRLIITVNDRLEEGGLPFEGHKTGQGLYIMTPNTRELSPVALPANVADGFHPHGMDLYMGPSGEEIISVINHHPDGERIEQFLVLGSGLSYLRTIEEPYPGANDLVMWDHQRLYVTIDHGARTPFGRKLEDYSRLGRGFVAFYDGTAWRPVASRLAFANGITKLEDGQHLAVAEMLARSYHVYKVGTEGGLTRESTVFVGAGIDNMTTDAEGTLWLATHPKLMQLAAMSKDRARRAPAQIWRVRQPLGPSPEAEEVFTDDGSLIAASSVALHSGEHLFVGSVYDDHLLICPAPK